MRVSELLRSPWGLKLRAGGSRAARRHVAAVVSTELNDPTPLLRSGDLVVTTGKSLYTVEQQSAFIDAAVASDVSGIAFVTGLSHVRVPDLLTAAADRYSLAVLEVPGVQAYDALLHFTARGTRADPLALSDAELYEAMAAIAFSSAGVRGLIEYYAQVIGHAVGLIDVWGHVKASAPAGSHLDPEAVLRRKAWQSRGRSQPTQIHEVRTSSGVLAYLYLGQPSEQTPTLRYLLQLIAAAMEREHLAELAHRRLLGQVIEDLADGTISDDEAEIRLERHIVKMDRRHAIVVASLTMNDPRVPMAPLTGNLSAAGNHPVVTAVAHGRFIAVLDEVHDLEATASAVYEQLRVLDTGQPAVGYGRFREGVEGMRWSYFEALQGALDGPGVHPPRTLSLARVMQATRTRILTQLSTEILDPLRGGDDTLVHTLRAFLDSDRSVAQTAEKLFMHRNTVRYRLQRIEEITGMSLDATDDIVQLAIALQLDSGTRRA